MFGALALLLLLSPQARWAVVQSRRRGDGVDESDGIDGGHGAQRTSDESTDACSAHDLQTFLEHADDKNRLMLAFANYGYLDFVLNWVHHLRKVGVSNFAVAAMDEEIISELKTRNIPHLVMPRLLDARVLDWGGEDFFERGRRTVEMVKDITRCGVDLLLSDLDTVWLRNPYDFIDKYPDADVLVSSDCLTSYNENGGLEPGAIVHESPLNIGIMHFSSRSHGLVAEWSRRLESNHTIWDQNGFNMVTTHGCVPNDPECENPDNAIKRIKFAESTYYDDLVCTTELGAFLKCDPKYSFRAMDGTTVGVLPVSLFCSGHTYFVQRMPKKLEQLPYVIHATYTFSKALGKRFRFREGMLWAVDPPEYFRRPGGYMSFEMDVPERLLHGVDSFSSKGHRELVWYQVSEQRKMITLCLSLSISLSHTHTLTHRC